MEVPEKLWFDVMGHEPSPMGIGLLRRLGRIQAVSIEEAQTWLNAREWYLGYRTFLLSVIPSRGKPLWEMLLDGDLDLSPSTLPLDLDAQYDENLNKGIESEDK
jgi:hypothetical protein